MKNILTIFKISLAVLFAVVISSCSKDTFESEADGAAPTTKGPNDISITLRQDWSYDNTYYYLNNVEVYNGWGFHGTYLGNTTMGPFIFYSMPGQFKKGDMITFHFWHGAQPDYVEPFILQVSHNGGEFRTIYETTRMNYSNHFNSLGLVQIFDGIHDEGEYTYVFHFTDPEEVKPYM